MTRNEVVASLMQTKPALAERGVQHIAIYGSRARGDNTPQSEIDLLVDVAPESRFSLLDLIGIEHLVGDMLGIRAHANTKDGLEARFARRIARDVVDVF